MKLHTNETDASGRVEALLGRCALRDAKALSELYQLVSPQLLGVLLRLLRRRELAEEALQDVMVKVWQRANQFEAYRGRGMAWLVSIARYRAIDLLRSQRVHQSIDEFDSDQLPDTNSEDMSDLSATDRMRAALEHCLAQLIEQQRECLRLAYVNGYSHDEIATETGNPLGTVKSWVRRGLTRLKACLES